MKPASDGVYACVSETQTMRVLRCIFFKLYCRVAVDDGNRRIVQRNLFLYYSLFSRPSDMRLTAATRLPSEFRLDEGRGLRSIQGRA